MARSLDRLSSRLDQMEKSGPVISSPLPERVGNQGQAPWVLSLSLGSVEVRRVAGPQTLFRFRLATFPILAFAVGLAYLSKPAIDLLSRRGLLRGTSPFAESRESGPPTLNQREIAGVSPAQTRPSPTVESAKALYQKGFEAMSTGELELAITRFEAALEQDPKHEESKRMLVLSLWNISDDQMERSEFSKAQKTLEKLSKHNPDDPQVRRLLNEVEQKISGR